MRLLVIALFAFALVFAGTEARTACGGPIPREGAVFCCCNTSMGMCCKEVSFCGGFIAGCFCNKAPHAE